MRDSEITKRNESRGMMKSTNAASAATMRNTSARLFLLSMLFGSLFLAGCGGGASSSLSSSTSIGDTVYTYQGVSNVTPQSFGETPPFWTFVLGQTESSFRYNGPTYGSATSVVSGNYSVDNGYLALTSQGQPLAAQGFALTVPSEAALLRPGSSSIPPVITAGMTSCPVIENSETFLFVALPGAAWYGSSTAAYGSVQASTDSTGTNWSFSNQTQSLLAGSGSPPSYPASFTATCGQGFNGYSVGVLGTTTWPTFSPEIAVSPNGFFTETATGAETSNANGGTNYAQQPFVGVVAPSSALSTTSLAAAQYLGLMYESFPANGGYSQTLTTQIVSFGTVVAGSGSTLTGGVFPNDDPSQTPAANITVNFGSQSATQNGLYNGVTVTIPDTSSIAGTCANNGGTPGTGANGSLTCSFDAVAVAGNPKNNFAIFLIGQDPTRSNAPFGLYLYQQQQQQ